MKGYPKTLATKTDIENIQKNHPEFRERIEQDLQQILDESDTVTKATTLIDPKDESKGYNTVTIPNPNPRWKQMGFASKSEISRMSKNIISEEIDKSCISDVETDRVKV